MSLRLLVRAGARELLAAVGLGGCSLALGGSAEQCRSHADCQALDPTYLCASDGVCVALSGSPGGGEADTGGACQSDAECASSAGQALCRGGSCRPLNDRQQGCVSLGWGTTAPPDGAPLVALGMLVPAGEIEGNPPSPRLAATVGLAILELNRARESLGLEQLPALVGVACDEARPEALSYLLDTLAVRVIFGPSDPARLDAALQQVGSRALLVPPFADAPHLEPTSSDPAGYVLSCRPNRSSVRVYLLPAIAEAAAWVGPLLPGPVVPGLAVSGDTATQSFGSGIDDGALAAAGVVRLPYIVEPGGRGLVNALASVEPPVNLVVAASAEDAWESNVAAVDGATYARTGSYPYYLLAEKRFSVLQAALRDQLSADGFPRQYLRMLGLDFARGAQSEQQRLDFESAFSAQLQSAAEPGLEYVYDCAYAAVYALVAGARRLGRPLGAEPLPELIVLGLRALQGGGASRAVGSFDIADVISSLELSQGADATLDLIGASGTLDFVLGAEDDGSAPLARRYLSTAAPGGELYCIDGVSQTFCDTGIIFPADGSAVIRPAAERCTCLRVDP